MAFAVAFCRGSSGAERKCDGLSQLENLSICRAVPDRDRQPEAGRHPERKKVLLSSDQLEDAKITNGANSCQNSREFTHCDESILAITEQENNAQNWMINLCEKYLLSACEADN